MTLNSSSLHKKPKETVVVLGPRQLPFETWRPIFQNVYATKNSISHPPCDFEFSLLHSRLNVYRNLALVSKSWRANARDVFFEELQAHTAEALRGIFDTFRSERSLALAVSRISFSFWEFRCSASRPRRPRPLRLAAEPEPRPSSSSPSGPDWKTIHRRDAQMYRPSGTSQGSHWTRWQADTAQVLSMCSSLSEVDISFTSSGSHVHLPINARIDYRSFFAPPDLTNERILTGLLCSPNLRKLHLKDPAPLEQYGPALASWSRLNDMSITLTRDFDELQETVFTPSKSLVSFRFHDGSSGRIPWPMASDLARCTNLQVLDLGVTTLTNGQTSLAIGFLCTAYQHSLRELTLKIIAGRHVGASHSSFQHILESNQPFQFQSLERLRLLGAGYDTSVFSLFKTEKLTYLEVGWLYLEPFTGTREDKWSKGLGYSSLRLLKRLVIDEDDPDHLRIEALHAVCERLGIQLEIGHARDMEALETQGGASGDDGGTYGFGGGMHGIEQI